MSAALWLVTLAVAFGAIGGLAVWWICREADAAPWDDDGRES